MIRAVHLVHQADLNALAQAQLGPLVNSHSRKRIQIIIIIAIIMITIKIIISKINPIIFYFNFDKKKLS